MTEQCLLPTLFNVVNNIEEYCSARISLQSGVKMLYPTYFKILFNAVFFNSEQVARFYAGNCAFLRVQKASRESKHDNKMAVAKTVGQPCREVFFNKFRHLF